MAVTLAKWIEKLNSAGIRDLNKEIRRAMIESALGAERGAKLNVTGKVLKRRSGNLANSIRSVVRGDKLTTEAVVSANAPQARAQEEGATIRPKKGKFLTIPIGAAKTAAGVARGSARDFPDLFFMLSKAGQPMLVRKRGDGIEPMFLLRRQVILRARPFLKPAMAAERKKLPARLHKALQRAVSHG